MTRIAKVSDSDQALPYDIPVGPKLSHTEVNSSFPSAPNRFLGGEDYALRFCRFLRDNPTVFHFVSSTKAYLEKEHRFTWLSERSQWNLKAGGRYIVTRNGSSLIAFVVGKDYKPGNGFALTAAHADALTAKLKPISKLETKAGYEQLGVAPYAGALNSTWWDRDLAIAGRVLVKGDDGKITTQLVDLKQPIARIPTLAPHFGAVAQGPFNQETQMVPIIGLESSGPSLHGDSEKGSPETTSSKVNFAATQPPRLVKAIAGELGIKDYTRIMNWELELYDSQPAQLGGLDKEFIYGGRLDDKLCSWTSIEGLAMSDHEASSGVIKCAALFDNEEIGSLLRQGARGNLLPSTMERIVQALSPSPAVGTTLMGQTYANSFLVSADNTHAVNPNFMNAYLPNHAPKLNVGMSISADSNGHMTTDAVSTALFQRIAERCGCILQVFQIRNDVRSGGTVGPMLSSAIGVRAVDAGIPQLSMHSIRATTGSLDPYLGIKMFKGFFDYYQEIDLEFQST